MHIGTSASTHGIKPMSQISVIIPTYNREGTIARAIDSVLAQEYPASEIIVIDDGSKDNTRRIVESYGGKVLRYVYQENEGVSAARNRGVNEARYQWIAFLDSDDYWLSHHLRHMVDAIDATRGEAALYFCDIKRAPDEGGHHHWDRCGFKISSPYEFRYDASDWALMTTQPMMLQASVIRRDSYLGMGGLPKNLQTREDTLFFFKSGLLYPACAVSGCGTVMTSDGNMRLTREIRSTSLPYWLATISVYREVLAMGDTISPARREILIDGLSESYFAIGRVFFRQKKYLSSIRNLFYSAFLSRSTFAKCFLGSLSWRHVLKRLKGVVRFYY